MTPAQFRSKLTGKSIPSVILFLGPDSWERERCRRELFDTLLGKEDRDSGLSRFDLDSSSLAEVLDDARALSLFAPVRVIHALGAEAALPRGRAGKDEEAASFQSLDEYLKRPTDGATVLLESGRYEFDNDDKAKVDRIRKFYAGVPWVVEFPRFSDAAAQALVRELAAAGGLRIQGPQVELLVETLSADASRIAGELEKLSLFLGPNGTVTEEHIDALVTDAKATTIFRLVAAIGAGNRTEALGFLDTLIRQNEYLPLALTFLSTQFRMALAARELNLRTSQQIQSHCQRIGMMMWKSRADQIADTSKRFSLPRLRRALRLIAYADRALRDARPDDRIVMENFVLRLTA